MRPDRSKAPAHPSGPDKRAGISQSMFIGITIASVLVLFSLCIVLVSSISSGSHEALESTQRRLVYATNPLQLLGAARQLIATSGSGDTQPIFVDPQSANMPLVVQKVHPRTITIDGGRVTFECGTNVYRFGLVVDPAAARAATQPTTQATKLATTRPFPPMAVRTLAPGIWYYAEDQAVPPP
jgi:hypothetical protein